MNAAETKAAILARIVAFYEDGVFIKPEPVAEQSLESKIHALEAQLSALKKQIAK